MKARVKKALLNPPAGRALTDTIEHEAQAGLAMQAFLEIWAADRHKRAPDAAAVALIARGFERWWRANGSRTLDEVFELTGTRGRPPIVGAMKEDFRNGWYRHLMCVLVGAGFSVEEAAEATAGHQSAHPEQLARTGATPLAAKTVRDVFEKLGGAKWARENNYCGDSPELQAEREDFISKLPKHLIPARFLK